MIDPRWMLLGAAINLYGSTRYAIDTIKGKTKPNRVTWFLWALAPLIAFAAMLQQGVSWLDGLMTFMVGFGPLLVLVVSFFSRKSVWKITTFDVVCGVLSLAGIVAWVLTRTGNVAILFSILADGLAGLPTLVKAWKEPTSESHVVFRNGVISAAITLLAIKEYDFQHLGFPVYILIICLTLYAVIRFKLGPMYRKRKNKKA